jgi:hypothetical protein
MTFGHALHATLQRNGYSLVSEFVTSRRRLAVRVRVQSSQEILEMFHSDAIELARGETTTSAIAFRNRAVTFTPS